MDLEKFSPYSEVPEFQERDTFIDDCETLGRLGIYIEDHDSLPLGFVKLWPQDFIVEEIARDGEIQSCYFEDFFKNAPCLETGSVVLATLVKCGLSTMQAVETLSKIFECDEAKIQYAGLKDDDAITAQVVSFKGITLDTLKRISTLNKFPHFFLKNFRVCKESIRNGELNGNRFTVLVRTGKDFNTDSFIRRLAKIKKSGFYNFYHLQRFGLPRLLNFQWGRCILLGNYEEAVYRFLTDATHRELPSFQQLREDMKKYFTEWRAMKEILRAFSHVFRNEWKVIEYLEGNPTDYRGALKIIPHQTRIWVYALPSFIFNKELSSYVRNDQKPPKYLPLFLGRRRAAWTAYKNILNELDISKGLLKNLEPFPHIHVADVDVKTRIQITMHKMQIVKEGVVLKFSLPKGAYATTFLAHLFRLYSGKPPAAISVTPMDTRTILGDVPFTGTLDYFHKANYPKHWVG